MDFPKLSIIRHIYDRPTTNQAMGKANEEYLRERVSEGHSVEAATVMVRGELEVSIREFLKRRREEQEGE